MPHLIMDGGPFGIMAIRPSTNLYAPSSFTLGGTPLRSALRIMRWSGVTSYASEASASMSLVVLTGAKRVRGMRIAWAPGKHSIAEPIAVSSCSTLVLALSRGSTVLPFLITGSGSTPSNFSYVALSAGRLIHRLLVLKKLPGVGYWGQG